MKKRQIVSVLILCVFLITLASQTLAAPITSGGSSTTGFQPIIDSINNAIDWAEFEGLMDILIWLVVPALGIYAIFRFIFGKSFEYAEQNFRENSSISRDGLSDMAEWSARVLAGAVSVITVVEWGGTFGWLMILAGIAGAVTFIWHVVAGTRGNLMPHPFGENDVSTDGGQIGQRLDQDEDEVKRDQDQIGDIEREIEDAEETSNDEEARDAGQKEEKVIMSLEDIESDLDDLLNLESKDLQNTIKEAQEILEQDKQEIKGLRSIQGRYERIEGLLQALRAGMRNALDNNVKLTNGNLRRVGFTGGGWSYANAKNHGYDVQGAGFKHVLQDLEEGMQQVQQISQIENQEEQEVKDEVKRVQKEANNFLEAYDLIKKINTEVDELEKEDKELEQIAKELGDKKLMKLAKKEEKQELSLEKKLDQLRDKEGMIESELEKALNLIEKELQFDQEEMREIKQELQETNQIEQDLENIRNRYIPQIDIQEGSGGRGNANKEVNEAENALEQIKQGLASIEKRKEQEANMLEEVENKIRQTISKVG